jgi:hypothetical protein
MVSRRSPITPKLEGDFISQGLQLEYSKRNTYAAVKKWVEAPPIPAYRRARVNSSSSRSFRIHIPLYHCINHVPACIVNDVDFKSKLGYLHLVYTYSFETSLLVDSPAFLLTTPRTAAFGFAKAAVQVLAEMHGPLDSFSATSISWLNMLTRTSSHTVSKSSLVSRCSQGLLPNEWWKNTTSWFISLREPREGRDHFVEESKAGVDFNFSFGVLDCQPFGDPRGMIGFRDLKSRLSVECIYRRPFRPFEDYNIRIKDLAVQ